MFGRYAFYRFLRAQEKLTEALAKREATLAAQETPKEATARQWKIIRGAVIASIITPVLFCKVHWFKLLELEYPLVLLLMIGVVAVVWWFLFRLFGPMSRAMAELIENERRQAVYEARRNEAIRQQRIRDGF